MNAAASFHSGLGPTEGGRGRLACVCVAIAALACSTTVDRARVVVERDSPGIRGGRLVESIGIETFGGVFSPLIESGCRLPCEATHTFSTAKDNQTEIAVSLFRGKEERTYDNHFLGEFVVTGIPPAPRGTPQVAVTIRTARNAIQISAVELSGAPVRIWRRSR